MTAALRPVVAMEERRIVALGGNGFDPVDAPLLRYVLSLSGKAEPKICFLPTACGDGKETIEWFHEGCARERCIPSVLRLFHRSVDDIAAFLLDQDVIYVGGGSTANMLAVWRLHGVDRVLRKAWERGVVMSGVSAGANCWFEACVTDSFGPELDPLRDGLCILEGSACSHYDGEVRRRPVLRRLVSEGFPGGIAVEDGVGVRYDGLQLAEVVSIRDGATAYHVQMGPRGFTETPLPARLLSATHENHPQDPSS